MVGIAFLLLLSVQFVSGENCRGGWDEYEERCYSLVDELLSWEDAAKFCEGSGAQLVEINSTELNDWVAGLLTHHGIMAIWTGANAAYTSEMMWLPSGRPVMPYQRWISGEPNRPESEHCAALIIRSPRAGKWESVDCNIKLTYICMRKRVGPICPFGFFNFRWTCYSFGSEMVTWEDAVVKCNNIRADLVEIDNVHVNRWLTAQIEIMRKYTGGACWIGGSTLYSGGRWAWIVSHIPMISFVNWDPWDLTGYARGYGAIELTAFPKTWQTKEVHRRLAFVCEKPFDFFGYDKLVFVR